MVTIGLGMFAFKQNKTNSKIHIEAKPTPSIRSDLLVPTDNTFLNRPNIIAKLEESLNNNEGIQAVALVGIGGAGKTTIARRFALQQNVNVVWEVNAATRENLKDSFERLAYGLCKSEEEKKVLVGLQNIKNKIERDEKILLFVKEKLKDISNWFLIYDNVDKFNDIQKYFPSDSTVWGKGKIIVTTSDSNTKNNSLIHNFIQIGELSPQDKLTLFMKIMTNEEEMQFTPDEEELAKNFLTDVPPFPLDISIAAYYLKSTHTPYAKYLERLKENSKDFENIKINVVKEASDYTKTRHRIVTLSLKQLIDTQKDFGDLLLLINLLNSQNIPRALLSNYKSDIVVDNFIYNLKKYSLVTSESSSDTIPIISIHRATQEISLNYLVKTLNLPNDIPLLDSMITTLEDYIVDATDKEDFSRMKLLVAHCETLLTHDHLLTETMKSSIGGALGCIYYYLRHNIQARKLLEESHVNLKKHYGENHVKVAPILVYLGNFYRSIGDYEKAKNLLEQSLIIYKKHPNYVRNARALGYLGVVYRDLGDYRKAKDLLEQSLVIHEKHSENHIGHAWILTHLGDIYMILGDYEKAKELFEKSLIIYKNHAEDYVGVGWVLSYLGAVHKSLGNYDKAENSLEQSLSITRKYFSDDHLFVASGLSLLAGVYIETGDYQKARNLLKDSLVVYERNYGKNHMETARVLRMLGEVYCIEGDMETSEDLINKSLLVFQQKNYPESYKSYESLALLSLKKEAQALSEEDIKQAQNFRTQAISDLKQALKIAKECFPEDPTHIARIQSKLASLDLP
jgi:tetratricopeptide (TPR) repeat protein